MKLLLDTHLLLWAAVSPHKIPVQARPLLNDAENAMLFSAASIWETAIKGALGRRNFTPDAPGLYRHLLDNGYAELPVSSRHGLATLHLPPLHKDPFDRLLVAQAWVEGVTLLTSDPVVARYPGPIRLV